MQFNMIEWDNEKVIDVYRGNDGMLFSDCMLAVG